MNITTPTVSTQETWFIISGQLYFEMLHLKIRFRTISFAAWRKKEARKSEHDLECQISVSHKSVRRIGVIGAVETLNDEQADLINLRQNTMEGVLIRSRTRQMEHF